MHPPAYSGRLASSVSSALISPHPRHAYRRRRQPPSSSFYFRVCATLTAPRRELALHQFRPTAGENYQLDGRALGCDLRHRGAASRRREDVATARGAHAQRPRANSSFAVPFFLAAFWHCCSAPGGPSRRILSRHPPASCLHTPLSIAPYRP